MEKHRICIKFCVNLKKTFTEIFCMLRTAFENECWSHSKCYKYFKKFKEGRTFTTNDPRSERPTVSNDDDHVVQVNYLERLNRSLTILTNRWMAEECKIFCMKLWKKRLKMLVSGKWVLQYDNVPVHSRSSFTIFARKISWQSYSQPP